MCDYRQPMHPEEEDELSLRLVRMVGFEFDRKLEHHRRLNEIA